MVRRSSHRRRKRPLLSLRSRVCHPRTRLYVRLLGPCFKTGRLPPFRQHLRNLSLGRAHGTEGRCRRGGSETVPAPPPAPRSSAHTTDADSAAPQWDASILAATASLLAISSPLHSLFKVLCIFPSRYLFAIGLLLIFSFRWNLPPA